MKQDDSVHSPTLTTKNLILRQLSIDDVQDVFHLRSDKEVNTYLGRQLCQNIEEAREFIHIILDPAIKNESYYWAITCRKTNIFFGTICLYNLLNDKRMAEIGFELLPSFQNKGIMKEAAQKVIDYAFNSIFIECIEAYTHQKNKSSTKLLEKLGFVASQEPSMENSELCCYFLKKT